ncbi:MAG: Na(+)/H(+) antiporter subunit D [Gammaproteobacteria bacterium]|nr:Na(+)/H(+) antiporter subunit D [Gammaproteobacteria bacterium]
MIDSLLTTLATLFTHPAVILIAGACLVQLLPQSTRTLNVRNIALLLLPLVSGAVLLSTPLGTVHGFMAGDLHIEWLRLDTLSFVFALIFHIALLLGQIYALHVRARTEQLAAVIYAAAAIGATLAGDLLSLFIWWELTAISSVFLIWANRDMPRARIQAVAMRYLIIQVSSGLALLAGLSLRYHETGRLAFDAIDPHSAAGMMILFAFGIKCAFPFLHNWLQDAYPHATPSGTVILSAFTTKLAVYALARGFAGFEALIVVGAVMTVFPIFFAVIENNMRRVLSYSLNNQLGFMVVGVGIGTELAINGTAAHAFAHIIYKSLLFMTTGAVLYRTGEIRASHLGGLYRSMPWTAGLCIIGALSISAFPLLSGFVTKSMIMSAAAIEGHHWVWMVLLFASAGVLDHSGIKVPFFTFFAHDSGKRCQEAPPHMLTAMILAALMCVGIGVYPQVLYNILPYAVDYHAYDVSHVLTQMQLLLFAACAFALLYTRGWYPAEIPSVNLDADWLYRRAAPALYRTLAYGTSQAAQCTRILATATLRQRPIHAITSTGTTLAKSLSDRLSRYALEQQFIWALAGIIIVLCLFLGRHLLS